MTRLWTVGIVDSGEQIQKHKQTDIQNHRGKDDQRQYLPEGASHEKRRAPKGNIEDCEDIAGREQRNAEDTGALEEVMSSWLRSFCCSFIFPESSVYQLLPHHSLHLDTEYKKKLKIDLHKFWVFLHFNFLEQSQND